MHFQNKMSFKWKSAICPEELTDIHMELYHSYIIGMKQLYSLNSYLNYNIHYAHLHIPLLQAILAKWFRPRYHWAPLYDWYKSAHNLSSIEFLL